MVTFTINIPLFCWHQSTIHTDPSWVPMKIVHIFPKESPDLPSLPTSSMGTACVATPAKISRGRAGGSIAARSSCRILPALRVKSTMAWMPLRRRCRNDALHCVLDVFFSNMNQCFCFNSMIQMENDATKNAKLLALGDFGGIPRCLGRHVGHCLSHVSNTCLHSQSFLEA